MIRKRAQAGLRFSLVDRSWSRDGRPTMHLGRSWCMLARSLGCAGVRSGWGGWFGRRQGEVKLAIHRRDARCAGCASYMAPTGIAPGPDLGA